MRTAAAMVALLALGACGTAADLESAQSPIEVEEIEGADVARITLSESAVERLDIQTANISTSDDGFFVPSAAVIIDPDGVYWVYTNPDPRVYVRSEIRNAHEEGLKTFFDTGPNVGMAVVTVGVPELYGAEVGIGK
jgi:hypothetical protein